MSYFKFLGLDREPFSTSPDPSFFFLSREHRAALCRLEIAITLRRGLCVLLGDVGTGKTTLSRKLAQGMKDPSDVLLRMVLNPYFRTEKQFLSRLASLFHVEVDPDATCLDHMEAIEKFLFQAAVERQQVVVLVIDEAQILPDHVLENLRILLNYETNDQKLLQLVLVGQLEFLARIRRINNFWDRIAVRYVLSPLGQDEVKELIEHRLRRAGHPSPDRVFTDGAIARIARHTQGYPRRLTTFCHDCLESLVMYDARVVDEGLVDRLIREEARWSQTANPEKAGGVTPVAQTSGPMRDLAVVGAEADLAFTSRN
jgi:general secretion pathway protein A